MFFTNIKISYDVRTYVRMLGLTKPAVQKFNKDKFYVDILYSNYNLFFEAYEFVGDAFYYSTVEQRKKLRNSNTNLCLKVR
jgi:hypothetical protein